MLILKKFYRHIFNKCLLCGKSRKNNFFPYRLFNPYWYRNCNKHFAFGSMYSVGKEKLLELIQK